MMKKADPNPHANRNIMIITYAILVMFLGMIGCFVYFLQAESEDVINNSYNARLDSFSDRIARGQILSSDGQVLAETQTGEDGAETRFILSGPFLPMWWVIPPRERPAWKAWGIFIS